MYLFKDGRRRIGPDRRRRNLRSRTPRRSRIHIESHSRVSAADCRTARNIILSKFENPGSPSSTLYDCRFQITPTQVARWECSGWRDRCALGINAVATSLLVPCDTFVTLSCVLRCYRAGESRMIQYVVKATKA